MTLSSLQYPVVVTIAICTRNRATLLQSCLQALLEQVDVMTDVELLVVDNGSSDSTQNIIALFADAFPCLSAVIEPEPGLSRARNRAIATAAASWVAFLDDDGRPLNAYVSRLKELVQDEAFDCVGGLYIPWYRDGRKKWFRNAYASNVNSIQRFGDLPIGCYASGGNFLVRKQAVLDVGGFLSELGMTGSRRAYGEEIRLQVELRRTGYSIGGDPALLIEHLTAMPKQSISTLLRSAWSAGRDYWVAFDEHPTAGMMLGLVRRLFSRPVLALYHELLRQPEKCTWQSISLAIMHPTVLTCSKLCEGMRLIVTRRF